MKTIKFPCERCPYNHICRDGQGCPEYEEPKEEEYEE